MKNARSVQCGEHINTCAQPPALHWTAMPPVNAITARRCETSAYQRTENGSERYAMIRATIDEKTSSSSAVEHAPFVAENALDDLRAELEFLKVELAYINGRVASKNAATHPAD